MLCLSLYNAFMKYVVKHDFLHNNRTLSAGDKTECCIVKVNIYTKC